MVAVRIVQISNTESTIELITDPIDGHNLDIKKMEHALKNNCDYRMLDKMQCKFQNWREFGDGLDCRDGEVMGKMLMLNSSGLISKYRSSRSKETRVKDFFENFRAMKTLKTEVSERSERALKKTRAMNPVKIATDGYIHY